MDAKVSLPTDIKNYLIQKKPKSGTQVQGYDMLKFSKRIAADSFWVLKGATQRRSIKADRW
jgi:hypothetical protein